ncbi:hypothetical protein [Burkholderia sp. BDU5]|nr:hypothetical protein [Burkholderia sp. BDU5]
MGDIARCEFGVVDSSVVFRFDEAVTTRRRRAMAATGKRFP